MLTASNRHTDYVSARGGSDTRYSRLFNIAFALSAVFLIAWWVL